MSLYSIFVQKNNGKMLPYGICYNEKDKPPIEAIPPDCVLVSFDENTLNYNDLYAMLVDDQNGSANKYLLPTHGGLIYDFESKTFELVLKPVIPIIDIIREERNRLLKLSDTYAMVPDYPVDLNKQILDYRKSLRDLPNTVANTVSNISEIQFPKMPEFLNPIK